MYKVCAVVLLLVIVFVGCSHGPDKPAPAQDSVFSKERWAVVKDDDYPYRMAMLNDLVTNHHVRGQKWQEVIGLLGEPTRTDNLHQFYEVHYKRVAGLTVHVTTLVIKFKADSTAEWMKIAE